MKCFDMYECLWIQKNGSVPPRTKVCVCVCGRGLLRLMAILQKNPQKTCDHNHKNEDIQVSQCILYEVQ